MNILMVAPEVVPFVKVGGLADVTGALPKALSQRGHDVRILCPLYGSLEPGADWKAHPDPFFIEMGDGTTFGRLWETTLPANGVTVYFLEYNRFYERAGVYAGPWGDHSDNGERFTLLSRAAIDLHRHTGWLPDVFHCHDWTTGLVPVYLNTTERDGPLGRCASVMTIHNLKFQGIFRPDLLQYAGLPRDVFRVDCLESMGFINMLKGGIYNATKITTVSPTYAEEIQGPERGEGLNHVLRFRAGDLVGVLNGIDEDHWDPLTDPHLPICYSASTVERKARCKTALQAELGLEVSAGIPLFVAVSRLYDQKGLDLLAGIIDELVRAMKLQIAILGSGESWLEAAFLAAANRHPGIVAARLGYDDGLAHRFYGGGDFFIMPSRFEPCGLSQMYAMRYGTPPLVRATGGLADTVDPYEEGLRRGTGFLFQDATGRALYDTIGWACSTYYDRPEDLKILRVNGMKKVFSWQAAAEKYESVYRWAIDARDWSRVSG